MSYDELLHDLQDSMVYIDEPVFSDVTGDDRASLDFELTVDNPRAVLAYTHPEINEDTPEEEIPTREDVLDTFTSAYEFEAPVADFGFQVKAI